MTQSCNLQIHLSAAVRSYLLILFYLTNPDLAWLFELAGGAIIDFEDTCVPKSQREASFTIAALHQWEMWIDDDRCIDSAEEVGVSLSPPPSSSFFITSKICSFVFLNTVDCRYFEAGACWRFFS